MKLGEEISLYIVNNFFLPPFPALWFIGICLAVGTIIGQKMYCNKAGVHYHTSDCIGDLCCAILFSWIHVTAFLTFMLLANAKRKKS